MKRKYVLMVVLALVLVGAVVVRAELPKITVDLPEYERPPELVRLDQNWTPEQRIAFHYTPQGTRLMPYDWFMALEQPCFSPFGCGMFAAPAYLSRFGFIPGDADLTLNPDGLPVGFAIDRKFVDPVTKQTYPVVGLNCAACHTGEFYYRNAVVQVEGAPGTIEVAAFQKALGLALGFNMKFPFSVGRYTRFEKRLLGPSPTDAQKADLKARLNAFLAPLLAEQEVAVAEHLYDHGAGFRRTDALTRIGNAVFGTYMKIDANYAVANAPVRYPQIWDASWFDWIQYNSSISDPLVRNIGEALGVRAQAKLYGPDAKKFENSINMAGLQKLEALLAGSAPLQGLRSPQWPSALPPLDPQKVAGGAALYVKHCQGCHLPPIKDVVAQRPTGAPATSTPSKYWVNNVGTWLIKVTNIPIDEIGTDPHEAQDYAQRTGRHRRPWAWPEDRARGPRAGDAHHRQQLLRRQQHSDERARDDVAKPRSRDVRGPGGSDAGPGRPRLQGPSAQRHLDGGHLPAQRLGAEPLPAAVAAVRSAGHVLCWQQALRPGQCRLRGNGNEGRHAVRHVSARQRQQRPRVQRRAAEHPRRHRPAPHA